MSDKSNSNSWNIILAFAILAIGCLMMMPVNNDQVAADISTMHPFVQTAYEDCPEVNRQIDQQGGGAPILCQSSKPPTRIPEQQLCKP